MSDYIKVKQNNEKSDEIIMAVEYVLLRIKMLLSYPFFIQISFGRTLASR